MFCFHCGIEISAEGLFCFGCRTKKRITLTEDNILTEREVIDYYFHCGYGYKAIVHLLEIYCDISLSEKTLKRGLQKYNLRKNSNTDDSVLRTIIRRELETPSQCVGYRGMWRLLRKSYSIQVPRNWVMKILREEDPEGTTQRRAHELVWRRYYFSFGSNFCWHCDITTNWNHTVCLFIVL